MTAKIAVVTVQKWGNSLAIRLPANLAKNAHFNLGTHVEIALHNEGILVKSVDTNELTLSERLALFDPQKHSGEIMASTSIGKEKF